VTAPVGQWRVEMQRQQQPELVPLYVALVRQPLLQRL
jgi:hypothetical protein